MKKTDTPRTKVAIIDDNDLFRDGIKLIIEQQGGFDVVYDSCEGTGFIKALGELRPDILLIDYKLPLMNGDEITRKALKIIPTLKVLTISMYDSPCYINMMKEAGARGYILKKSGKKAILNAINEVLSGGNYITNHCTIN
jgi:two-component system response regulator DegU